MRTKVILLGVKTNMSDSKEPSDEECLIKEINKEIDKVKYFMEEIEELIEIQDYSKMEIVNKSAVKIIAKLSDLISDRKIGVANGKCETLRDGETSVFLCEPETF